MPIRKFSNTKIYLLPDSLITQMDSNYCSCVLGYRVYIRQTTSVSKAGYGKPRLAFSVVFKYPCNLSVGTGACNHLTSNTV